MPIQPFRKINVDSKQLDTYKFGNPNGVPVLVADSAPIYMESLRLEKFCCLYGVADYWMKGTGFSSQEIFQLDPNKLGDDLESDRKALEDAGEPVKNIVSLGPSAIELISAIHNEQHPQSILATIMPNSTLGFDGLEKAQKIFLKKKYSLRFLKEYEDKQQLRKVFTRSRFLDGTTLYIIELIFNEQRYYKNSTVAKKMYQKWPDFNLKMRYHFFNIITKHDMAFLKRVERPVMNTLGKKDGVIPPDFLTNQINVAPRNYKQHIFDFAHHVPPLEDNSFFQIIKKWS